YSSTMGSFSQEGRELTSLGAGVIMDPRGYILTNQHVINNADQIIVALQNGDLYEGLLIGSDPLTDLAVLKVDAEKLPTIPINSK
ncbi:trypsin-like peptidase domain-containing protein, partial [Proteus mirabilis]